MNSNSLTVKCASLFAAGNVSRDSPATKSEEKRIFRRLCTSSLLRSVL